jgi:hypothetical protein
MHRASSAPPSSECYIQGLNSTVGSLVLPLRIDAMARVVAVFIVVDMHSVRLVVLRLVLGS